MKKRKIPILLLLLLVLLSGCTSLESLEGSESKADHSSEESTDIRKEVKDEIKQFHMTGVEASEFELDYQGHAIMALQEVAVRGIPLESVEENRVLNYELVKVWAAVHTDNGDWALVSYDTVDGGDDIGWVRVSDLTKYTTDTKEKLQYPVNVSEECKDIETGEPVRQTRWRIVSIEGERVCITRVGGRENIVRLEDIVYPDTGEQEE